jgi:hypothetical protein
MWSARRGRNEAAGFSLAEALVALAIAAFLAAVLTRFVSGTRWNALKVREEVEMEIMSDDLLERFVARELQPGRTNGRSGALRWQIDIAPITFYARARSVSEKKPTTAGGGQPSALGLTAVANNSNEASASAGGGQASALGLAAVSNNPDKQLQAVAQAQPAVTWNPYHVTAVINPPSGRSHAIDTIRIAPQRAEPRPAQADQR